MAQTERVRHDIGLTEGTIRYRALRAKGLCENCKGESPVHSRCDACRERRNSLTRVRHNPTLNQKLRSYRYNRKKYRTLKSKGLCTDCKAPNGNGKAKCESCQKEKQKQAYRRYHRRKDAGLCPICEHPSGDYVHCETCREANRRKNTRSIRRERINYLNVDFTILREIEIGINPYKSNVVWEEMNKAGVFGPYYVVVTKKRLELLRRKGKILYNWDAKKWEKVA